MHTAMTWWIAATAAVAATLGSSAAAQTAGSPRAQTDQTVPVMRGARLTVNNYAGKVIVRAWNRDAVRVQARHSASGVRVSVVTADNRIDVSAAHRGSIDYEFHVPAWMPVKVDGHFAYIAIEGTDSEISAETVRGGVSIKGGSTFVSAKSIDGEITLDGSRGRISVSSVNRGVNVAAATGEIVAETINGAITLSRIESASVEAGTVNGHVSFEGVVLRRGRYRFSTHNGNIVVTVPGSSHATFSVRTYNGSLNATLPLQRSGNAARGRRATYTLGTGDAEFEVESFGGTIHLRRQDAPPGAPEPRKK